MKKKGFTLIELLAVIVILAVIAIIVTPMIMGTINSVRQSAIKSSAQSIIHAAETFCTRKQTSGESFSDKSFVLNESTANTIGYSYNNELTGVIAIYSDCKVAIATTNGVYQATKNKTEDDVVTATKSATFDDDAKKLVITTPESCFMTSDNADGTITITEYDSNTCGINVVIPETINSKNVSIIGEYSFYPYKVCDEKELYGENCKYPNKKNPIESVDLSNMNFLKSINEYAFEGNKLTEVVIDNLNNLTEIGNSAFDANDISSINITNMKSLVTINGRAFCNNEIKNLKLENLPKLTTIDYNSFPRNEQYILNDNDEIVKSGESCEPTYYFNNLPNLKNVADDAFTGICDECEGKLPIISKTDNFPSVMQNYDYSKKEICG